MGTEIRYGLATNVDFSGHPHKVQVDEEKWISADAVIISTGASAKWLGYLVPGFHQDNLDNFQLL